MTIREGRWRCPRCNRENLGRHMECQGCGDTRDDDVTFYLPDADSEVTDDELLARAGAGADQLCEFCDASNPPEAEACEGCGAPLGTRQREQEYHPERQQAAVRVPPPPPGRPARRMGRGARLGLLGCLGAGGALLLALVAASLWQTEVTLEVSRVSWERSLDAEKLVSVTRSGWEDEVPAGARPRARRRAIRSQRQLQTGTTTATENERYRVQVGTEKVKVGTRDLGIGFFEDVFEERPVYETRTRQKQVTRPVYEQQPVYGVEVTYELDEWKVGRRARASGSDLEPRWPELAQGERERSGSRSAKYQVVLKGSNGKRYTHEVRASEFQRYSLGSRHLAKIDALGGMRKLRPKR